MNQFLCLEDFSSRIQDSETEEAAVVLAEEQRLEAYEQGYRAGWDDCTETDSHELSKAARETNEALAELSFGFEEASSAILSGLTPLFKQVTDHIVPEMLQATLGHHLEAMLAQCAQDALEKGVVLRVHPDAVASLKSALSNTPTLTAALAPDPSVPSGQILVAGPKAEVLIDQFRLSQEIQSALAPLNSQLTKGNAND